MPRLNSLESPGCRDSLKPKPNLNNSPGHNGEAARDLAAGHTDLQIPRDTVKKEGQAEAENSLNQEKSPLNTSVVIEVTDVQPALELTPIAGIETGRQPTSPPFL